MATSIVHMIRRLPARNCMLACCLTLVLSLPACGETEQATPAESVSPSYDLLLSGGTVVDGTGSDRFAGDIGIEDGRIAFIGDLSSVTATETIDISGLVVAPGFIDTHSHADQALNDTETAGIEGFLRQGVTTAVYGVDGFMSLENLNRYIALGQSGGMGINFMSYVGHNAVRQAVMGNENRAPSDTEFDEMKSLVAQGMELGAAGLSTGLMYLPGSYADTEEVIELAKVTAPYGAVYDSHVRDPANNLLASHQECLDIALAAGVDAHPGHIKAVGGKNFGKGPDIVQLIEAGIARGQTVTVDLYPYDGAATAPIIALLYPGNDETGRSLMSRLSAIMFEGSEDDPAPLLAELTTYWDSLAGRADEYAQAKANTESPAEGIFSWVDVVGYQSMRIVVSERPDFEGRMVTELAEELGISPFELYRRIAVSEGASAMVTLGAIPEADIREIMKQPWAMISSDGAEVDPDHPRGRGTFARVLGRYARDWGVLTLEEAVHKISGLPARYLKLTDRGVIKTGAVADLTVFNPETVIDRATWSEPGLYSEGIEHVLIGGEFAFRNGEVTAQRLGKFVPFTGDSR